MAIASSDVALRLVACLCGVCLQRTVTAMAKVGIPPEQRDSVFATVAAVLHLGNVSFVEGKDSDSSQVAPGAAAEHLQAAGGCAAVALWLGRWYSGSCAAHWHGRAAGDMQAAVSC